MTAQFTDVPVAEEIRDRLPATGAASEATLADVLAAIEALSGLGGGGTTGGALEATQQDVLAAVDGLEALETAVRDRIGDTSSPAAGTLLARLEAVRALLAGTLTVDGTATVDGTVALDSATLAALETINVGNLPADPATATGVSLVKSAVDAVTAKLIAAPATEAKQDAQVTALGTLATQSTAAAILAKLSSDPATQTTLAAVLAKLTSDPSTATLQGTANTTLAALNTKTPTADANGWDVDVTRVAPKSTATGSATTASVLIGPVDVSRFAGMSLDVTGTFTGTIVVEVSQDASVGSWRTLSLRTVGSGVPFSSITGAFAGDGPLAWPWVQVRASALSAGTALAAATFTPTFVPSPFNNVDTELSTGVVLSSDAVSNPTAPAVGAFGMDYDSTVGQWRRRATRTSTATTGAGTASVTTTSSAAVAASATRAGLLLTNTGTTTVSLGLGTAAVAGQGIVLQPGAAWDGLISNVLWSGAVNAIVASGTGSLGVVAL